MPDDVLKAFAAGVQSKVRLEKFGESKDIAQAALFLASEDSAFMTGCDCWLMAARVKYLSYGFRARLRP